VLTSDQEWDVTAVSNETNIIVPTLLDEPDTFNGTFNTTCIQAHVSISNVEQADLLTLQARMAWMPMEVLERTLKCTTRLAKNYFRLLLRQHYKSRFPQSNKNRLRETYCTDTFVSSVQALSTKATCMQIFVGRDSIYTAVYEMTSESEGPKMLESFIADVGAPFSIMSDNAKMQTSRAWTAILRKYNINLHTTEAYNPQQNYAERRIQEVKKIANRIMDHTNSPDSLWAYATKYAVDILNHSTSQRLNWKTPIERAFGITPDISALTQYCFFEPIYFFDASMPFPNSKELPGRFLGLASSVGDALTYYVLTQNNTVIARSVLRSALDLNKVNLRGLSTNQEEESMTAGNMVVPVPFADEQAAFQHQNIHNLETDWNRVGGEAQEPPIQSTRDLIGDKENPVFDPYKYIGFEFVKEHNNVQQKATVTNWTEEGKFILRFLNGGEELITYNELINHFNQNEEENAEMYSFKSILDHKKENGF